MTPELEAKLQTLEAQLAADLESESLREQILFEYLGPGLAGEPRRIHHAVEYVRRFPRTVVARAPYVRVDQETFPAAFAQIEQEWLRLLAEHPADPELAQGRAALVASSDRDRAVRILDDALKQNPEAPGLWLELGRICAEPARCLNALQKARALGASQPNLLTWLARAAIEAGDAVAAAQVANELLGQVAESRSIYGTSCCLPQRLPIRDSQSSIILYQTKDGRTRIRCRFENETIWLTQKLMAELFQKDVRTINEHIQNVFAEAELAEESVIRKFRITAADGKSYDTQHYNIEVVIAVGYRVKSARGTQFRQWATARLNEYLVKGFTMDDERLSVGVEELDQEKLTPLLRLRYHNSIADAVADLGRPDEIGRVFADFQKYLYQRRAVA